MPRRTTHEQLGQVPLFTSLSRRQLRRVADVAVRLEVPEGFVLIAEGTEGHEFVVVLEGSVEVRRDDGTVAELGPGDFFGEVALVERRPRNATVVAKTSAVVDVLGYDTFSALLADAPDVAREIDAAIERRRPDGP